MSIGTVKVIRGFLFVLFLLTGCGNENGVDWGERDGDPGGDGKEKTDVRVVLCPKIGGKVKFMLLDSLEVIDTDMEIPSEVRYLGNAASSSMLAALGEDKVYLVQVDGGSEKRSVKLPAVSQDIQIVPTSEGMLILDRLAGRLIGVDLREGVINLDRTLAHHPEDVYYFSSEDKIVLVMRKGTRGVVSVFSPGGDESMTINLDTILCSASVAEKGRIYLVTYGAGGARLEAFRIEDLSRVFDIYLEQAPGRVIHTHGSNKLYIYFPQSGLVKTIDLERGDIVSEIPLEEAGEGRFFSDEAGNYVYLLQVETGHLTIVSTVTDLVVGEIENHDGDTRLVTTPDSRLILLQDKGGSRIRLYDGETFQLLRVFMEDTPMTIGLFRESGDELEIEEVLVADSSTDKAVVTRGEEVISVPEVGEESELFTLQVFSSDELSSSERVFDELLLKGFPASIVEAMVAGKGAWYRVRVGEFTSREDALAVGEYLTSALGLDYWITGLEGGDVIDVVDIESYLQGQDMDSDGFPEVAIVSSHGAVHLFSLRGGRYIPRWNLVLPGDQVLCGSITYTDRNGDGLPEALIPLCPLDRMYMIAWNGIEFHGDAG